MTNEREPLLAASTESVETEDSTDNEQDRATIKNYRRCSNITVEPLGFAFTMFFAMLYPVTQQFLHAYIARQYNTSAAELGNASTCFVNHSDPIYETQQAVQHETSTWTAILNASILPFAFVSTLALGSYSDRGGRKLPMLVCAVWLGYGNIQGDIQQ